MTRDIKVRTLVTTPHIPGVWRVAADNGVFAMLEPFSEAAFTWSRTNNCWCGKLFRAVSWLAPSTDRACVGATR